MKRSSLTLVALFAVALLATAASSSPTGITVLKTRGYVRHIAADGARVAAATDFASKTNTCYFVLVWNPAKKAITRIVTGVNCETASAVDDVPEIALAGKRVVWLEVVGGNYVDLTLRSRVLDKKKIVTIASASNGTGAAEDSTGGYVENVFGDGNLLAYNSWSVCLALPVGSEWDAAEICPEPATGDHPINTLSKQKLHVVANGRGIAIASAPDTQAADARAMSLTVVAVDAGRIVTHEPGGSVTLYSADGDVLTQIAVPSGAFSGFALRGSQLVTLRDDNLELYDVDTGALTSTTPLASGAVLRDLQSGLAVYVLGRKVHVLRLSDGKDIAYSPPGKGAIDAQIESSGLFYSYNFPGGLDHGRIAFVRLAKVRQRLG